MTALSARTVAEWRAWLARNCRTEREVWLIIHRKDSSTPGMRYHEAIEHALCYGWIDSHARRRDASSTLLRFSPRTSRSTWSRVNRERAAKMIESGLMTEPGWAAIEHARSHGTWQVLSDAQSSVIPEDLLALLQRNDAARANFESFPPSSKRLILEWIAAARRPETRRRRIEQTASLAAVNIRANHPGSPRAGSGRPSRATAGTRN